MTIRTREEFEALRAKLANGDYADNQELQAELIRQAKEFKRNPNYSQVYLYRNEPLGFAISMPVTVNGQLVGNTGPMSYFKFDLPAGYHTFTSQGDKSVLKVQTKLGGTYYIWQKMKTGLFIGGSELRLVTASEGKKGVRICTLIESPEITAKPKSYAERVKCIPNVGCTYE